MSTYALVHGAWHDGSLWAPVAAAIRDEGHEVHTPTLAGNGHGDDIDRTIGHADATHSAIDFIEQNGLEDFVLVGHSYGGTIISAVAEAIGERIRRLVYWNAFVLLDGESIDDVSPPHYKDMLDGVTAERATARAFSPSRCGAKPSATTWPCRRLSGPTPSPAPIPARRSRTR